MTAIKYLKNEQISNLFKNANQYQKSALTGLRLLQPNEIGTAYITYVQKDGQLRKESEGVLTDGVVMARNKSIIGQIDGKDIYNEWPIAYATVIKNYGESVFNSLTTDFSFHKKAATVAAIELTSEIMKILGVDGDVLQISVDWSDQPMLAHIGDYLSSGGYSISANDMKDYEQI